MRASRHTYNVSCDPTQRVTRPCHIWMWDMTSASSHPTERCNIRRICIYTYEHIQVYNRVNMSDMTFASSHPMERCNTRPRTAPHCNIFENSQERHDFWHSSRHDFCNSQWMPSALPTKNFNTLQRTATHCNTLQHTATHCNTLQHTVQTWLLPLSVAEVTSFLRRPCQRGTLTHCNTLQHTCNVTLECETRLMPLRIATHCNTLQHTATHYNVTLECETRLMPLHI